MLAPSGREHDCRTADISPGDARLAINGALQVGDQVVIYLDKLGRVSGRVVRLYDEGECAIVFDVSPYKREKLAETLTVLLNPDRLSPEDGAEASVAARKPAARRATIETEDGKLLDGEVLDFSLAGLTLRVLGQKPGIGDWVRIGNVHGKVARYTDTGFSVDFEFSGKSAARLAPSGSGRPKGAAS